MPELLQRPVLEPNAQLFRGVAAIPDEATLFQLERQFTVERAIEPSVTYAPRHLAEKRSLRESIARSRLGRKIGASVAALTVAVVGVALEASPAVADSNQEYTIADSAAGGVYSRNSPHMDDTPRIDGVGIYPGDKVRLICGVTDGEAVGPKDNKTWHKIVNLTRPEQGEFWEDDHFFKTPNKPNELAPGEENCNDVVKRLPTEIVSPLTPHHAGSCKTNTNEVALESINNALAGVSSDDGGLKSQLENYGKLWGNPQADDICVGAKLSDIDHVNHRQFISTIVSAAPDIPASCGSQMLVEVWGDGFYKKGYCSSPMEWEINRWLSVGTNVCAAISTAAGLGYFRTPQEAANAVLDGKIKLGESNPYRQIACFEIKE